MERINNRIDPSFGFERHFIRGLAKPVVGKREPDYFVVSLNPASGY